jgi:SAM-dependent methyltransferase
MVKNMAEDARLYAPAALRNREPIASLLRDALPPRGTVLEIASGTGEHSAYLARQFPNLTFQPSDTEPSALASIAAWREAERTPNLAAPLALDARSLPWPITAADAILCINMIHISPWEAGLALFRGAADLLPNGGLLFLYGPYRRGAETEESNLEFDTSLKRRNPEWGLRELSTVLETADAHGFDTEQVVAMPANNRSMLLRKR